MNKIIDLYDIKKKDINDKQIKYYHLDKYEQYHPKDNYHQMFFDIDEFDYIEPIKRLKNYFIDDKYYSSIYDKIKKIPIKNKMINNIDEYYKILELVDIENIILQYIKCRPESIILFLYNVDTNYIVNEIKYDYNIYYWKDIELTTNGIKRLLYELYDEMTLQKRIEYIDKLILEIKIKKIGIIWIERKDKISRFKREIIFRIQTLNNKIKENQIYINTHFYQTIENSQIILNNNSLEMLLQGNINILYTNGFLKFNTLRNWCYNNLTLLDMTRLIIYGSTLLYALGIRSLNDINGILIPVVKNQTEIELEELINFNLTHKIPFIDIAIEDSKYRNKSYNKEIKDYIKSHNLTFSEISLNPRYHWYYQGIKMYHLDYEIEKKCLNIINKNNINDIADLIVMYFNYRLLLKNYIQMKNKKLIFCNIKNKEITISQSKIIYKKIENNYGNISKISEKTIISIL
jgi:hypothetical protein